MDEHLLDVMARSERDCVVPPFGEALTVSARAFTSEAWYGLEIERVFAPNWTAVVPACELPDAGEVRPFDLIDRPLVAVGAHQDAGAEALGRRDGALAGVRAEERV